MPNPFIMSFESYEAHWRAAAKDAVPYHKDFTEWLTMLIELFNGGKNPTEISLQLSFRGETFVMKYRDNGYGCSVSEANHRLLRWAAVVSVDGKSIYGHGTKKFLAKCGDYHTLDFAIRSRAKGSRDIHQWKGPFKGIDTTCEVVEIDDFPKHGFEVEVVVDIQKLGTYNTPEKVFYALKEIICMRKHQSLLSSVKFLVETFQGETLVKKEDSITHQWKSFQETIATHSACKRLLHVEKDFVPGKVKLVFDSYTTGALVQIPGFPVYGNMTGAVGTRTHIGNEDTIIEAHPWWDIHNRAPHPSEWHRVDFAYFIPMDPKNKEHLEALPEPATTKVAYRYESESWRSFVTLMRRIYQEHKKELDLPAKKDLKSPALQSASNAPSAAASPVVGGASGATPVLQGTKAATPMLKGATPATAKEESLEKIRQIQLKDTNGSSPVPVPVSAGGGAGGGAAPAPAPASSTVEKVEAKEFGNNGILNEKYNALVHQKKSPQRYSLPKWLKCEDLLVYKENGKYKCIFYRERQKGELEHDVEKAYTALVRFANQHKLTPSQVSMDFCLHSNNVLSKHTSAFNEIKGRMTPSHYPFIQCMALTQMTNK